MKNFTVKYKIWLEDEKNDSILGEEKCNFLKTVEETGSLNEAVKKYGYTYRKTWDNLNKIEKKLGFKLLDRQRGGKEGGKTTLTNQGKAIIKAFDNFHEKYDDFIEKALLEVIDEINKNIK